MKQIIIIKYLIGFLGLSAMTKLGGKSVFVLQLMFVTKKKV